MTFILFLLYNIIINKQMIYFQISTKILEFDSFVELQLFKFMEFKNKFQSILQQIGKTEQQLQNYRQLLNSEIQFNLTDLILIVNAQSTCSNTFTLLQFVNSNELTLDSHPIQSLIKFYNNNTSLNLSFVQFSLMFITRQNLLLAKMVLERPPMGAMPTYLLNFAKKIIHIEAKLHTNLIQFRKSYSFQTQNLILQMQSDPPILPKLKQYFDDNIHFDLFLRYLQKIPNQEINTEALQLLLTSKNNQIINKFLKDRKSQKNPSGLINPFIRPQFHDCLERPKLIQGFSYREVKSIEKHLQRVNSGYKIDLNRKIQRYRRCIQKMVSKVCLALKEIIMLEKDIQYARIDLSLCADFYPVLFFQSFHLDKKKRLIPSVFKSYIKSMGCQIPINQVYLIFKRYSRLQEGKMTFNSFCKIFDLKCRIFSRVNKNRQVKCLDDISLDTKRSFIHLIEVIGECQAKIEKIKEGLCSQKNMDLRDSFNCIDMDGDGYISLSDLRVVWKKLLNLQIQEDQLQFLWFRIGYRQSNRMIKYQQFVNQLSIKK